MAKDDTEKRKKIGRTMWDVIDEIRPKRLKVFQLFFLFIAACTLLAIHSGNPDGNIFYYIRTLASKLYKDKDILVAILIILCTVLFVLMCVLLYAIHYIYKPRVKYLREQLRQYARETGSCYAKNIDAEKQPKIPLT